MFGLQGDLLRKVAQSTLTIKDSFETVTDISVPRSYVESKKGVKRGMDQL